MVKVQKIVALILSLSLLVAIFSSCSSGSTAEWVLKIDGVEIKTGEYLSFQQVAYENAKTEIAKEENLQIKEAAVNGEDIEALQKKLDKQDFLKKTIDGKNTADWTTEETLSLCKRYVAAMRLAESEKVDLTESNYSEISSQVTTYYSPYATTYYDYLGIGEKAYVTTLESAVREDNLFNHWYGEGGTDEVSEEQISDYFVNNYAKGAVYTVYGSSLEEDELTHREELLNQTAESLNNGAEFGVAVKEYEDTIKKEEEEKKIASDAALASDSSTAEESAIEESTSTEDVESDTSIESSEETSIDTEETEVEEEEEELPKITAYTQIFNLEDGSSYLAKPITNAISSETTFGHYQVIKNSGNLYLVSRLELEGTGTDIESYSTTVLKKMMDDAFKARLDETSAEYPIEKESSALSFYTVKRFVKRYNARFSQ